MTDQPHSGSRWEPTDQPTEGPSHLSGEADADDDAARSGDRT